METFLHLGCGNRKLPGFINTDKEMDISQPWPHTDSSVDGIVSMQVIQQLQWRDIMFALKEAYRVLKVGGVIRFGTMFPENNTIVHMLGWNNITALSFELLAKALHEVGFSVVHRCEYQQSALPILATADNRHLGRGTAFIEASKL